MKNISVKIQSFVLIFPFCLVLSTVFAVDETLAMGVVSAKYFWFYGAMGLSSIFLLLVYAFRRNTVKIYIVDLLLILFVGAVLIINYFAFAKALTTKWILLLLLLQLFLFFRVTLQDKALRFYLLLFFVFTGLVEAVWGLMQLYGFAPSNHNLFKLTGSFFNSGPYSGYLAVVVPVALFFMLKDAVVFQRKFFMGYLPYYLRFTVSTLALLCVLLVLPATLSRAAWIAILAGCGLVVSQFYLKKRTVQDYLNYRRKKVTVFLSILFLLLATGAVGVYYLKKDSADGRLLIWKTSLGVIAENPMGVGLGHFPSAYGKAQAAYFASGSGTVQEELIAGNPEYAFNEFIQIMIEFGLVPAIVLFTCFIMLLYWGIKQKLIPETAGLLALLVFASMSYPFNLLPFLIVLVFFMALILTKEQPLKTNLFVERALTLNWRLVFVLMLFSASAVYATLLHQYPCYKSYKTWGNLKMAAGTTASPEIAKEYEVLYPHLSDQIQFLFEYAQCLAKTEQYQKSNTVLEQACHISCDPMLYNIMGKNNQALGDFNAAESNFQMAAHLVPNRIYPYYLLANLYAEKGKTDNAILMARTVMEKAPKVPSTAIQEMREKMRELIAKMEGKCIISKKLIISKYCCCVNF